MSVLRLPIPGLEFQRGLEGRKFLARYFRDLLPSKRAGADGDMFSRLARAQNESGERFDDADVVDHMIFAMMAAHDTTTSTLTSMTYELARHPECRSACVRRPSRSERLPSSSTISTAPAISAGDEGDAAPLPAAAGDPPPGGGRVFLRGLPHPGGTMVVVAPIHTHHMPEWFPAPRLFDPERFSPERAEDQRHTHAWIPSAGARTTALGLRLPKRR